MRFDLGLWFPVWNALLAPAAVSAARRNIAEVEPDERHIRANRWWVSVNTGLAASVVAASLAAATLGPTRAVPPDEALGLSAYAVLVFWWLHRGVRREPHLS